MSYIDREDVIRRIRAVASAIGFENPAVAIDCVVNILERTPEADVAPVVRGRWIENPKPDRFEFKRNCRVCNGGSDLATNYCPNCGAYMRG